MTLTELIKDNYAYFDSYRQGFFYYHIIYTTNEPMVGMGLTAGPNSLETEVYQFTIPREDFENATLNYKEKAITLMKWIKKAMDKGELIKVSK